MPSYFEEDIEPDKEEFDQEDGAGMILGGDVTAGNTDRFKYHGQDPEGIEYLFQ